VRPGRPRAGGRRAARRARAPSEPGWTDALLGPGGSHASAKSLLNSSKKAHVPAAHATLAAICARGSQSQRKAETVAEAPPIHEQA
jgi:hypothetical protein